MFHRLKLMLGKISWSILVCLFAFSCNTNQKDAKEDTLVNLVNSTAQLEVDLFGGSICSFKLLDHPINPLSWKLSVEDMPLNNKNGATFKGHFLCLGRWGSPSEGEIKAGVPHNGEPSKNEWQVLDQKSNLLEMACQAPLDGLFINRTVTLDKQNPIVYVTEKIKNSFSLSRPYNIVQHPTLAPPFLTAETIINSNAGKGFLQSRCFPNPHEQEFNWPFAKYEDEPDSIDLQKSNESRNYCSTHIFPDSVKYGWVTALNPQEGLLFGYVWKTEEYPWLNVWHQFTDGKPKSKGIEFGTTGIGRPYKDLILHNTAFHGKQSFEYIDAGETVTKSYIFFLIKTSSINYVTNINITKDSLTIYQGSNQTEKIAYKLSNKQ